MRNLLTFTTGLLLATTACDSAPEELRDPPVLKVTSPQRSLIQAGAAAITVTGTVAPNIHGDVVEKVLVNNVTTPYIDSWVNGDRKTTVPPGQRQWFSIEYQWNAVVLKAGGNEDIITRDPRYLRGDFLTDTWNLTLAGD